MLRSLVSRVSRPIGLIKSENSLANIGIVRKISSDSEPDTRTVLENIDTAKCLNRVTLLGRAVGRPNTFNIRNTEMIHFTLVTNEIRRDREDKFVKRSEFHNIQVVYPRQVAKAKNVIQKGSRILVEGKINYNVKRGENGVVTFTNIIAENLVFITGQKEKHEEVEYEEELSEESEIKQ